MWPGTAPVTATTARSAAPSGCGANSAPPSTSEAAKPTSPSPESPLSTHPLNSLRRPRYPNILTGGTWCPGGFLFFVADNGCSFRLGKPGKGPLQVGKDWAETAASFVQFTPGLWYHLAATFKRPHVQTYVNGKAVATAVWDYPIGFSGDLQIGMWGDPQTCHHGLIDEVRLYNRALTAEEVLAEFQRTAAGRGPDVDGWPTAPRRALGLLRSGCRRGRNDLVCL